MPVVSRSNNRILPANARASDVAKKAIQEILPAQQTRYMSALRVQGYAGILYNRLEQGKRCTCQSSQKHLNTRLDKEGKASKGLINQLITGSDTFDVTPYGHQNWNPQNPFTNETSPLAPGNKHQGTFGLVMNDPTDYPIGEVIEGPVDPDLDIEKMFGDWDGSLLGGSDIACSVCFGTGFVGGYMPFHASRQVFSVADPFVTLGECDIDALAKPWTAKGSKFFVTCTFPLGATGMDIIRVMDDSTPVNAQFTIDSTLITNELQVLKFCDGLPHLIEINFPEDLRFTHFELQFNLTHESAFFEFPKLTKSADITRLETLEPFQIILSPNIPSVRPMDIIVESTFGKVLVVQNVPWWNTRNRNVLGWECMVRVIEPMERFRLLPPRGRIKTKNETTNTQHDNMRGPHRT
jgi:hypothetical protein